MPRCIFGNDGNCKLLNKPIDKNCHCPYFATQEISCDFCGKLILSGGVYENGKIFCDDCGHQLGNCVTCRPKGHTTDRQKWQYDLVFSREKPEPS